MKIILWFLSDNKTISGILIIWIIVFLYFFFASESFLFRSFQRHQNILSWYIRPLLVLPFCYFAYKKSINGILLVVLCIFTSMFWFPTPELVPEQVSAFLDREKEYILGDMTWGKWGFFTVVVAYFIFLARAFWTRSRRLGIAIVIWAGLGKGIWSYMMSPETWAVAMPIAIAGILIFLWALLMYKKYKKM